MLVQRTGDTAGNTPPASEPDNTMSQPMPPENETSGSAFTANADGQFVVDVESLPLDGDWRATRDYPGYEGDTAYLWTGPNRYGSIPDNADGVLSFEHRC